MRVIWPNDIKFRTCSALASMWAPPINETAELTQGNIYCSYLLWGPPSPLYLLDKVPGIRAESGGWALEALDQLDGVVHRHQSPEDSGGEKVLDIGQLCCGGGRRAVLVSWFGGGLAAQGRGQAVHTPRHFFDIWEKRSALKALTDHLGGGSRVDSFDPQW